MDATRQPDDGGDEDPDRPGSSNTRNSYSGSTGDVYQGRDFHFHQAVPSPRRDVPYTVPAAPAAFVNRIRELDSLDTAAARAKAVGGTAIAVCTGLPGSGKSAAIRAWAARTRDRFPGGQLYVDFAEIPGERGSRDPKDAVARVLRSLGVTDEFMPGTVEEMSSLFRDRTAQEATLVVVEGVGEPGPVRMLTPNAAGSAVVVTPEAAPLDELSLDAARFVAFGPLEAESGRALIAEICGPERVGAEPEAADRVVALCGGHPLALMVSAARLSRDARLSVAELAAELADEDRRLGALSLRGDATVTAAFNTAYRALPADAARVYRRLGLWPGPAVSAEIAAVARDDGGADAGAGSGAGDGADPGAVRATLEGAGLIEPCPHDPEAVRFPHGLVRLHARECAQTEEPAAERARLLHGYLRAYLARVAFADRAVMGERLRMVDHAALTEGRGDPFESRTAALEWLHAERTGLVAAVHAAVRADLPELAWPLAEAATALYFNHRYVQDWAEIGALGADAARDAGAPWAEARLRSLVSRPLTDLGRLDDAGEQVRRASELVADCPDPRLRASVAEFRGRYLDHTDPEGAVAAYRESLALNLRADEQRGAALVRLFLGSALGRSGSRADALAYLESALAWFRDADDDRMAGRALLALGQLHNRTGATDRARETLDSAASALAAGDRYPHYEAQAREALADLLESDGEAAAARPHLERALHLHTANGSPRARVLTERLERLD